MTTIDESSSGRDRKTDVSAANRVVFRQPVNNARPHAGRSVRPALAGSFTSRSLERSTGDFLSASTPR